MASLESILEKLSNTIEENSKSIREIKDDLNNIKQKLYLQSKTLNEKLEDIKSSNINSATLVEEMAYHLLEDNEEETNLNKIKLTVDRFIN